AEAINTTCYVQNKVLVTKPYNKTPYELLLGRSPSIGFMRPFGCSVTILNTLDPLRKFDEKADEGFLVGYYVNSKGFRVFNSRTRNVQETLHINFFENKPNVAGIGPKWLFDIDTLTKSMNYQPVVTGNQPNDNAGIQENLDAGKVRKETVSAHEYVLLPLWSTGSQDPQNTDDDVADVAFDVKENENDVHVSLSGSDKTDNKKHNDMAKRDDKGKIGPNPTNSTNIASPSVNVVSPNFEISRKSSFVDPSKYPDDPDMPELEDIVYSDDEEDVGAETDLSNLETNISVSPIPTTRVHKDHTVTQIIGDLTSAPQISSLTRMVKEQGGLHQINDEDFHTCMRACFLSQEEPKRVHQELKDPSWIESMQEELLQFKMQKMDVKSTFLYGNIEEEVYVCQPLGFEDLDYPNKVYKVVKALYGLHQAPRACKELASPKQMALGKDISNPFMAGFDQIVDFLDAHPIQYALMVNPTIYVLCIKQFWATATIKKVNDAVQQCALIDEKKVVVSEDVILRDLRLDDADRVECLPNEDIFAELERMSAKRTAWNKFSCSMVSAFIFLATVLINNQVEDLTSHNTRYTSPALTLKKVAELEQDKHTQALEILKLKKRVKELEKKKKSKYLGFKRLRKIKAIDADEDITLVDMETQEEVVNIDVEPQGRIDQDDVNVVKPTIFDDEEEVSKYEKETSLHSSSQKEHDNIFKEHGWPDKDVEEPKKKRVAEETLLQESFKKLKSVKVLGLESTQETPSNDHKEMSEKDVQNMLEIVPMSEFKVEALQSFENMLKGVDREDLVALWNLVKEKFSSAVLRVDKEKALWVELKRSFEPDADDMLWKLQRYMHYPITWKLHTNCGVHHVSSTTKRHDMFMLTEKDYPLSNGVMTLMLNARLQVEEDNKMARDLVMKIFMKANKLKSRSLNTSSK
nr:retrovirus-related Pol polyprotein from transposon TNT 1-94 [Tanacetum cinerariifolium]